MLLEEPTVELADKARLEQLCADEREMWLAMIRRRATTAHAARRDPEDILQDAYFKAVRRWDAFAASGMDLKSWFYRIILDCLLDDHDFHKAGRRSARAEKPFPDQSSQQLAAKLFHQEPGPGTELGEEEHQALLRLRIAQVMADLKEEDREVLCMRLCEELSHEQIGQVLDLSPGTVRQRYARARLRFGELWKERFGEEGV